MQNINTCWQKKVNGQQSFQLLMTVNNKLKCRPNWKNKKYLNNLANHLLVVLLTINTLVMYNHMALNGDYTPRKAAGQNETQQQNCQE